MGNKYYTPTIEEFHVGFECEWRRFEEDWHGGKINSSIELYDAAIEYEAGENQTYEYRVKYLDKEDIESLGWENVEDRGMSENYGYSFQKPIQYLSGGTAHYRLRYWFINHRVRIEPLGGSIFDGTIKNKSELKVLLKQLGIE